MATWTAVYSGSVGGYFRLYLDIDLISQNTSANTSYVRYRVRMYRTSGSYRVWNLTYSGTTSSINISGQSGASNNNYGYDFNYGVGSFVTLIDVYRTIPHNADGTGSTSANCAANASNSPYLTTASIGTQTLTLPTIPRYATISSYTQDQVSDTSFRMKLDPDVACDRFDYSLNGGAWTSYYTSSSSGAQYKTFTGLESDKTYTIRGRVRRTDSGLYTYTSTVNVTTDRQNNFIRFFGRF